MKEQKKKHLFTNRQLAALLIPLALDQLLNSFMGTVDTLIVSNIGSAAISAVSLVDAINILVVEAFLALAAGGTVVCSQYLGNKDVEKANKAAGQLVFVTFFLSLLMAVICIAFHEPILRAAAVHITLDHLSHTQRCCDRMHHYTVLFVHIQNARTAQGSPVRRLASALGVKCRGVQRYGKIAVRGHAAQHSSTEL